MFLCLHCTFSTVSASSGSGDPSRNGSGDPSSRGSGDPSSGGSGDPSGRGSGDPSSGGSGDPSCGGSGDPSGSGYGGSPIFTNVTVTATTSTILWSQQSTDPVLFFILSWSYEGPCNGSGTPSDGFQVINDTSRNSIMLAGLRPNSQYLVTLIAVTNAGEAFSQILVNTTIEGNDLEVANKH